MDSLPSLLLLLAICLGHAVLLVAHLNWWFGIALPWKWVHPLVRLTTGFAIAGGWVIFAWLWATDHLPSPSTGTGAGSWLGLTYLGLCLVVGLVVFPLVTLQRWLRRPPAALVREAVQTIDIASALGFKPIAFTRKALPAYLPGNEIFQVDFVERTLAFPDLPPVWHGLRMLHLSDLHFRGAPDRQFYRQVLDRCLDWEPDLVMVTGDIVDSKRHHRWVVPLLGPMKGRYGTFAILGNHDYWYDPQRVRRRLQRIGMQVLENRWQQIEVRGEPMLVIGHEGPWFQPTPDLSDCPTEGFRVCLSHTPDNIAWARKWGIQLMLSGHNHGGQIRFPVIGSVMVPSRYGRRYDCGTFYEAPTLLHVCRGLGAQHPVRYNCRPEVVLLVLQSRSGRSHAPQLDNDTAKAEQSVHL